MSTLTRLLGRRLAALPFMLLGVTILVFLVLQVAPGDRATFVLGPDASEAAKAAWRHDHGLDQPLVVQFFAYLAKLVTFDFGVTNPPEEPVGAKIAAAFPITLELTFLGVLIAVALALVLGILGALYRDRWPDQLIRIFSIAAIATPSFWLGILLIQWFALPAGSLFPVGGLAWADQYGFVGWLYSMALPSLALGLPVAASLIRVVRTSMVEELDKDYVRTAIGNGVPYRTVVARNVLRNALVTPVTVLGLRIGYLLGGAIVIEAIFDLHGMGQLIISGLAGKDVNLVAGGVITIAATFVLVNIVVDLLYLLINPRIRTV
ncbi:peptide/nickel transport system permease protein [Sinomonas atrocyanea]|uniref:ABC transporter permease n=1 Tax=Sinomonas atrocyanea TaxID=37927 RepID=UPI0027820709|nr:ABC transporter permease [Sinomonas atrocyanea]MDP9882702.1 peptide/nickel transport system permease protein [Sinomonas atrocyanea]